MTKEERAEMLVLMQEVVSPINSELTKINTRLDGIEKEVKSVKADTTYIKKQVDILYDWTDGIDLDVRKLKQAK